MSRFYVPPENVDERNDRIHVGRDEAHHIIDVMRLKEGDMAVVFDGTGSQYTGYIEKLDPKGMSLVIHIIKTEKPDQEKRPTVYLAQAVPKKDKMDYIVEKATELGVNFIFPMITERTIVRPDRASSLKKESRWKMIVKEAAKQCGRMDIPVVGDIASFEEFVASFDKYDIVLLAYLGEGTMPLKKVLSGFTSGKILVLIGPEGDFTPGEIDMARKNNVRFISLGKNVLKSDTAGLFVLSALGYEFSSRE